MKINFIGLLSLLLLAHFSIKAQQPFLIGNIKNEITGQPIAQSSLIIVKKQIGTVSNAEGKFILQYADIKDSDSIRISCIGYQTRILPVSSVKSKPNLDIYLKPIVVELSEITVRNVSVPEILKNAIYKTDSLIPSEDNLSAYYKEFAYLDEKLYKYADAAVQYEIKNGDKKSKVKMRIVESRIKKDSVTEENKWKSDVETLISPDKALKDYYSLKYLYKFVHPKQIQKYTYKIQSSGDISKISVDPKPEIHQYLPNAIIYINTLTNRIIQVEYGYITHLKYMPKINLIFIAYSCEKDHMIGVYSDGDVPFLRYCKVQQNIRFKLGNKKGLLGSVAEILVHNNNEPQQLEKESDLYKKSNIFENGNHFSNEFWYKYNTILPTSEELRMLSL